MRAAAGADGSALDLLGQAGVVAVRLADLSSPGGRGRGKDGRTALAVAGAGRITAGDLVLPSGLATLEGRVKGTTRRAMTPALAIRFTLLMTLMPDADYPAVLETLLGDLILVPWQRPCRLPTAAVACTWRAAIGAPRIKDMLATGTHVLIRVKDGVTLRRAGDFLPDGSCLATISGGGITLTVRVTEYHITVAGRDAPELFCLITDLHDHDAYLAAVLAHAYHWRWIGSETLLKEAKSAITGAGPSTGPILRSQSPALVAQEHAAWVTAVELARAAARAAAAVAVPARRGRRAGQPVHPRQISFTAARRAIIGSARSGAATASLPAPLITANRDRILAGLARCRITVDRSRHRDRKTKGRPSFPAGGPRPATCTAAAEISICGTLAA